VSLTIRGDTSFKTKIGAASSLIVFIVITYYLAHGALLNVQRIGELILQTKTIVDGDPVDSYKQNFTMYAGPIGSEVPEYEVAEGTKAKSLIFNVAFGLSDRND